MRYHRLPQTEREWDYVDDDRELPPVAVDTRPLNERCPCCNETKHADNALCDECGDVVGCACCAKTGVMPNGEPCGEGCQP